MKDQDLETLLHQLKPAPLPDDLQSRLSAEPGRSRRARKRLVIAFVSGLAAAVAVFLGMIILVSPATKTASDAVASGSGQLTVPGEGKVVAPRPVRVVKKDSTLLNSRLLEIKEYDGELWEISEEEWRDDTLVLYSAGPSQLNATVIRREVVCAPLNFQ
jgi:hypothetical protein